MRIRQIRRVALARWPRRRGRWRAPDAPAGGGRRRWGPAAHPVRSVVVLERLAGLADEYRLVVAQLSDPDVLSDQRKLRDVSRRHHELEPIFEAYQEYRSAVGDVEAAREMLADAEGDEQREMRREIDEGEARQRDLEEQLKVLLLPRDPNDGKNVILEIRGAEGGEEANLFARDLHEMYSRYVEHLGLKVEIMEADASEMGGFNQVTTLVKGPVAWSHLKYEGGPHRVQRVPVTESQGRIHTSSATVTVLPEAEEADVHIEEKDLKVDVYRSSGPGGQSVNTTDSAVRVTHLPTGTVVSMQDEKSQIQNRAKAMVVLRSRLLKAEQDRQAAELSDARRSQVGGGGRSEKIRTYNYKENRVTDHRIGLTIYKLDKVLMGDLDDVVDALMADERARQLAGGDGGS
jgi:peptide chain release factor 1